MKQKGYLLIESVVAITLLIVGFLGMLALLSNSIALNRVVNDQFIGNYLAMEGVEIIKNLIDGNIIQGKPWNENINNGDFEVSYASSQLEPDQRRRLLFDLTNNKYNYQTGNQTAFIRIVSIEFIDANEVKVNSVVKWSGRGGGKFEINLEDYFFNWKN
jgi:type II secretory pathway pseudopilin PulG